MYIYIFFYFFFNDKATTEIYNRSLHDALPICKVLGGGLAFMMNADYRISDASTKFNYGNLPRGVCPGLLLSENLEKTVGAFWAKHLYINDYTIDATQACEIGLVHELAESSQEIGRAHV